jgi:TolA-binding protein
MATDTDKSLDDIRREVIESRNLVIKTDNLLKNLHAELKLVGKRQEDFERRQYISSGVAYLGFLALCAAGAFLVSNARTSNAAAEKERLDKQVAELTQKVDQQRTEMQASQASEQRAAEVYRQMTTTTGDDRLRAVDALGKLDLKSLSPFAQRALQDRASLIRKEVGGGMLERGRKAYLHNEWGTAAEEMTRFLALNPPEDDMYEATYALGYSLFQQHKFDQSMPQLERFVAGDKKLKNRDYAMLMLVQVYDAVGQKDKGTELCKEALNQYPNSEFANGFRMRLRRVEGQQGQGGGATGQAPAPAAAPNATATPTATTGAANGAAEPARQPLKPATPAPAPAPAAAPH